MPALPCPLCDYRTDDLEVAAAVAILTIHGTSHPPAVATPTATHSEAVKVERVKRPTISPGGTSQDWKYFVTRWTDYKTATRITGTEVLIQLVECCDEQLRKDLTRSLGASPLTKTEDQILDSMKLLAVREENVMVDMI